MLDLEIYLNKIVQNIITTNTAIDWFSKFSFNKQREILNVLKVFIVEAQANDEDAKLAIKQSGLKYTFTPCVLILKGNLKRQLGKICNLPANEYKKAFMLFIFLFKIADERRRINRCKGSCNHWWHKDLSDENIINEIKERRRNREI